MTPRERRMLTELARSRSKECEECAPHLEKAAHLVAARAHTLAFDAWHDLPADEGGATAASHERARQTHEAMARKLQG